MSWPNRDLGHACRVLDAVEYVARYARYVPPMTCVMGGGKFQDSVGINAAIREGLILATQDKRPDDPPGHRTGLIRLTVPDGALERAWEAVEKLESRATETAIERAYADDEE